MLAKPSLLVAGGLAATFLVVSRPAHADRRAFTHTYEYMTQPRGGLDLEFYSTQETATFETDSPTAYGLEIETEYGVTDHFDVALYQVFAASEGDIVAEPLHPDETKIEMRYRLAERGEWPVDVLLYFELFKPFGVMAVGAEPKLVLARDFGRLTVALNLALEFEPEEEVGATETEVEYEIEPEFAAGVTYEIDPSFKVGAETWGNFEAFEGEAGYPAYAGPVLSWAPSTKVWIAGTAGFALVDGANDFNFRFAIGLSL